jgi:3-deoxy-D-manno-octulosonic-acid transferase
MTSAFRPNIKQQIVLLGYSLLWLLLLPILGCHFVFQGVRGKAGYTKARLSRYGIVQQSIATDGLLIHCASVGEVVAIQGLVRQRLISHPSQGICISTNTTTGADRVKALFADKVSHCYLPYDFALFVWAFLAKIKPAQVLINEMELWPNLCHLSWKMNIPVSIINGRMSDKSCRTYQKAPSLFVPMFNKITTVCAQGQRDYDNYLALGVHSQRLFLTNNIKFDLSISQDDIKLTEQLRQQFNLKGRLILVAGSTHDPEEQILVDAYRDLYKRFPELLLIIVPRHPARFVKVHKLLIGKNINVSRLSEKQPCVAQTQVLLCDQMGWLRAIYGLATVAFVGGSLVS